VHAAVIDSELIEDATQKARLMKQLLHFLRDDIAQERFLLTGSRGHTT